MEKQDVKNEVEVLQYASVFRQGKRSTVNKVGLYFCLSFVFVADLLAPYQRFVEFQRLDLSILADIWLFVSLPWCLLGLAVFRPSTWHFRGNRAIWWTYLLSLAWIVVIFFNQ